MANFNKVILIGNLTKDPELRYTPNGAAVINFTLAVNRRYKSGEETKQDTAFVPIVLWKRTAEIVNQYCKKGDPLMVEGRLQTRSWEKDGQRQYKTEVVGENIQLLGKKKEETAPADEGADWLQEEQPPEGEGL